MSFQYFFIYFYVVAPLVALFACRILGFVLERHIIVPIYHIGFRPSCMQIVNPINETLGFVFAFPCLERHIIVPIYHFGLHACQL